MSKIYIVTDGSYSTYRILAVFSDKEKAEKYAHYECVKNEVEEYELDVVKHLEGFFHYNVHLDSEGNQPRRKQVERVGPNQQYSTFSDAYKCMLFGVTATDEEHAVKIANERMAQIKAAGLWPASFFHYVEMRKKGLYDQFHWEK